MDPITHLIPFENDSSFICSIVGVSMMNLPRRYKSINLSMLRETIPQFQNFDHPGILAWERPFSDSMYSLRVVDDRFRQFVEQEVRTLRPWKCDENTSRTFYKTKSRATSAVFTLPPA